MAEDLMRYDQLAQTALRNGVVREALKRAEKQGLPGDHHFYITFNTTFPGVDIGDRMLAKYPREMTIVLQHQFSNLRIHEELFEVELSFDNILERLVIPFESLKAFFDPAVPFGLQFEVVQTQKLGPTDRHGETPSALKSGPATKKPPKASTDVSDNSAPQTQGGDNDTPKVISLDSFRKK